MIIMIYNPKKTEFFSLHTVYYMPKGKKKGVARSPLNKSCPFFHAVLDGAGYLGRAGRGKYHQQQYDVKNNNS